MESHSVYQKAATLGEFSGDDEDAILDTVERIFTEETAVRLEESPNGIAELATPDDIPAGHQPDVREAIEERLESSLDSYEAVVLNKRVSWPEPRYEICIDFE